MNMNVTQIFTCAIYVLVSLEMTSGHVQKCWNTVVPDQQYAIVGRPMSLSSLQRPLDRVLVQGPLQQVTPPLYQPVSCHILSCTINKSNKKAKKTKQYSVMWRLLMLKHVCYTMFYLHHRTLQLLTWKPSNKTCNMSLIWHVVYKCPYCTSRSFGINTVGCIWFAETLPANISSWRSGSETQVVRYQPGYICDSAATDQSHSNIH